MSGRVAPVAERVAPVTWCTTTALTLVVAGGIVMASSVPRRPPLTVPVVLLAAAVVALGAGLALLARHRPFAWGLFWRVLRWALLAYAVSAGMIEFAFVRDGTRGAALAVVTAMLVVFATSVPITIAVTTAQGGDG